MEREQAEPPVAVGAGQREALDGVAEHRVDSDALQEARAVRMGEVRPRGGEVVRQAARLADGCGGAHVCGDGRFAVGRPDAHAEGGVVGHAAAAAALYIFERRGGILRAGAPVRKRDCVHI